MDSGQSERHEGARAIFRGVQRLNLGPFDRNIDSNVEEVVLVALETVLERDILPAESHVGRSQRM